MNGSKLEIFSGAHCGHRITAFTQVPHHMVGCLILQGVVGGADLCTCCVDDQSAVLVTASGAVAQASPEVAYLICGKVQPVRKQLYHKLSAIQQQLEAGIAAVGDTSHHDFWTANLSSG